MDPWLSAAVERRTTLLRDEVKHSYELVSVEFERSFDRAASRLEELFDAYDEYVRLVLGRPGIRDRSTGHDLVFTIAHRPDEPTELAFRVMSPESAEAIEQD